MVKIFFRRIHLYLALLAGIVIMITCLTGSILVFEKELMQLFNRQRYFVTEQANRLPADTLIKKVQLHHPGVKINSIKIYSNPGRSAEVSFSKPEPKKEKGNNTKEKKPAEGVRLVAFVDPYEGKVIEVYNHRKSFFYFVMDLHRWMLGGDTGKLVVGICSLVFLFILITGIILWWPRNRQILKQRLKIKRDAGFKRLNHDYHIVFGFYSAIFLFVFAFTGLAWSFEWFNKGIYTLSNSSMERQKPPKSKISGNAGVSAEFALEKVSSQVKGVYYTVALPKDSADVYAITLLSNTASHESATDTYFVDAYRGEIKGVQKFTDRNTGQKIRATFKPVHVASIYGTPSKIIGLIVCLLGTFFPLSGYIMWINRVRKKNRNKRMATSV